MSFEQIKESKDFLNFLKSNKTKEFISDIEKLIEKSELFLEPRYDRVGEYGKENNSFKTKSIKKVDVYNGKLDDGLRFDGMKGKPHSIYIHQVFIYVGLSNPFFQDFPFWSKSKKGKYNTNGFRILILHTPTTPVGTYEKTKFFKRKKLNLYLTEQHHFITVPASNEIINDEYFYDETDLKYFDKGDDDKLEIELFKKENKIFDFKHLIKQINSSDNPYDLEDSMKDFFNELNEFISNSLNKYYSEFQNFNNETNSKLSEFDKDGNGQLDAVEIKDDFDKLVKKHQSKIIDTDRSYIQHFVKVSNYQKQKRKNLQSIFESISKTEDQKELSSQVELLKEQIHSYELLLFHSLNMVTSLVEDDMFTFYEIYESFDKLEIFNSNHENEVSKRLKNIEGGIGKLITSIKQMEENIIGELGYLSYVTQDSYNELSNNVTRELESIDSSIKSNNLLTGINAYQTYKLRKGK